MDNVNRKPTAAVKEADHAGWRAWPGCRFVFHVDLVGRSGMGEAWPSERGAQPVTAASLPRSGYGMSRSPYKKSLTLLADRGQNLWHTVIVQAVSSNAAALAAQLIHEGEQPASFEICAGFEWAVEGES